MRPVDVGALYGVCRPAVHPPEVVPYFGLILHSGLQGQPTSILMQGLVAFTKHSGFGICVDLLPRVVPQACPCTGTCTENGVRVSCTEYGVLSWKHGNLLNLPQRTSHIWMHGCICILRTSSLYSVQVPRTSALCKQEHEDARIRLARDASGPAALCLDPSR